MNELIKIIVRNTVFIYRRFAPKWVRNLCRYHPTCSEYMLLAMDKHGGAKGFFKGCYRICRCHPLSRKGIDFP